MVRPEHCKNVIEMLETLKEQAYSDGSRTIIMDVTKISFLFVIDKAIEIINNGGRQ